MTAQENTRHQRRGLSWSSPLYEKALFFFFISALVGNLFCISLLVNTKGLLVILPVSLIFGALGGYIIERSLRKLQDYRDSLVANPSNGVGCFACVAITATLFFGQAFMAINAIGNGTAQHIAKFEVREKVISKKSSYLVAYNNILGKQTIMVSPDLFDSLNKDDTVPLHVQDGLLGLPIVQARYCACNADAEWKPGLKPF